MSMQPPYKLTIKTILPKTAIEGEIFKVTYVIMNISKTIFPGGDIYVIVSWPSIGPSMLVTHPIKIKALKPGEQFQLSREEKPATSGMTIFTHPNVPFLARNGVPIELYLEDGRKLVAGQLIGGVRARSHEEISQARAVWIAAVSLVVLLIFQVIDWLIRRYWGL